MQGETRSIFRGEAARQYLQKREKSVLPRLIRPRVFLYLWVLLGLLVLAVVLAWSARVPVYASGLATVVREGDGTAVVVLVPAEHHNRLAVGQKVWVRWDGAREAASTVVQRVEEVQSPAAVQKRFGLSGGSTLVTQPVAVVLVDLTPLPTALPQAAYEGSTGQGNVEVGSRRVLALLPGVSGLFVD